MLLDSVNKSLEIDLVAAVTTNQLPFVAVWSDQTTTAFTPGCTDGATNSMTAVTMVAAPLASTQRRIHSISVWNADTQPATVIIQLNNAATLRTIMRVTLAVGDHLQYEAHKGWAVRDAYGNEKIGAATIIKGALSKGGWFDAANLTAVTAMTTGQCHVIYDEVAAKASSSLDVRINCTTAVATITWAEIAVYKGTPRLGNTTLDLTRLGWVDTSAIFNTTGLKQITIPLTTPVQAGDNIYVVVGCQATTVHQFRGCLADQLQSGYFQTLTARLSLTAGPTAGTLAGAAVVPPVHFIYLN